MQRRSLSCIARVQNTSNSKVKKNKKKAYMLCEWIGALGKWVQKKILILSPKIHAAENNVKKNYCMKIELLSWKSWKMINFALLMYVLDAVS